MSKSKKLSVLQVASGDLWAGAEVQLYNLSLALQGEEAVTLSVVLLNDGQLADQLRESGVNVYIIDESTRSFFQLYRDLIAVCRRVSPDIIHSHRQKENVLSAICSLRLSIPSIRTVHGAPEFKQKALSFSGLAAILDRLAGRFVQLRVVAVSSDLAKKLLVHYPESHISTIKNGILRQEQSAPVRLDPNYVHVGIVGRLVPVKRHDIFIKMAGKILESEKKDSIRFWVVGDGPLRVELDRLVDSMGLLNRISFTGHLSTALPYLCSLDVLVMCSDHEGTPMTLLEAMSCGLPIIAHDVGGLTELLSNGECGYLVKDHSAEGYASALQEVLGDSEATQSRVSLAKTRIQQLYSADKNCGQYLALYREILR